MRNHTDEINHQDSSIKILFVLLSEFLTCLPHSHNQCHSGVVVFLRDDQRNWLTERVTFVRVVLCGLAPVVIQLGIEYISAY